MTGHHDSLKSAGSDPTIHALPAAGAHTHAQRYNVLHRIGRLMDSLRDWLRESPSAELDMEFERSDCGCSDYEFGESTSGGPYGRV